MGLESASMRRCLLWHNFIVRGTRTAGPKTQTDPWQGGFRIVLETVIHVHVCLCLRRVNTTSFFILFACVKLLLWKTWNKKGAQPSLTLPIWCKVINRTIKQLSSRLQLWPCVVLCSNKQFHNSRSIRIQKQPLQKSYICPASQLQEHYNFFSLSLRDHDEWFFLSLTSKAKLDFSTISCHTESKRSF